MSDSVPGPTGGEASTPAGESPIPTLHPGRRRVVDAARELFSARGYERTPLRAISDSLGVTKAALYYHFRAKEDLLTAVVTPMLDRIDAVVDSVGPGLESTEQRRQLLSRYVRELSTSADVTALLIRDPAVAEHPVGQRFASQRAGIRARLGADDELATVIRTATALRALELAVVEFGDADPVQVQETAIVVAIAVLEAGRAPAD